MSDQGQKLAALAFLAEALAVGPDRRIDVKIGRALGWRVSQDGYWNWQGYVPGKGPVFDPPGDEWCIRRDARRDVPCNESLPTFTFMPRRDALALISEA